MRSDLFGRLPWFLRSPPADCGSGAAYVTIKSRRLISAAIRWLECDQHNVRNVIIAPAFLPGPVGAWLFFF